MGHRHEYRQHRGRAALQRRVKIGIMEQAPGMGFVSGHGFSRAARPRPVPTFCHSEPGAKPGEEPAAPIAVTKKVGLKLAVEP